MNHQDKILAIHITDRKIYNNYDLSVKFQLSLHPSHFKDWDKIMKDLLYLCDYLSKLRIKPKTQEEILQRRSRIEQTLKMKEKNSKKSK